MCTSTNDQKHPELHNKEMSVSAWPLASPSHNFQEIFALPALRTRAVRQRLLILTHAVHPIIRVWVSAWGTCCSRFICLPAQKLHHTWLQNSHVKNHPSTTEWAKLQQCKRSVAQPKLRVVRDHYNFKSIFSWRNKAVTFLQFGLLFKDLYPKFKPLHLGTLSVAEYVFRQSEKD